MAGLLACARRKQRYVRIVEAFFDQQDSNVCTPSPFKFSRHGECGMDFSELLRQFGLDHTQLTYPHQGRNVSLTDADITGVEPVLSLVE